MTSASDAPSKTSINDAAPADAGHDLPDPRANFVWLPFGARTDDVYLALERRGEAADVFFYDTPSLRYLPEAYYWLARAQEPIGIDEARENYEWYLEHLDDFDVLEVADVRDSYLDGVRQG